ELVTVALCPEQIGAALVHRDDVVVGDRGHDPLALAPNARPVGPLVQLVALVEQLGPLRARALGQGSEVVNDFEQPTAGRTGVNRLCYRPGTVTTLETAECCSIGHGADYIVSAVRVESEGEARTFLG